MSLRQRAGVMYSLLLGLNLLGCGETSSTKVTVPDPMPPDMVTFHNDVSRSGQNLNETILTHQNVNVNTFGKVGFFAVDGKVDAQPLFLANVNIPGQGPRPTLYVATEHGTIYAFDADTGEPLWSTSLLGAGEVPSDPRSCLITPEIGITATPVIDRTRGPNGAIYAVAMSKDVAGNYHQRLHALDVTSGAELFGGPQEISASFPGTGDNSSGGVVIFDPKQYKERAALLLLNGVIYTTWASHCDVRPYTGWIIPYDATTLQQEHVLNLTPNGNDGAIWMSGGGPAADTAGNIYLLDGNGTFDQTLDARGFPSQGNFGNAFLRLSVVRDSMGGFNPTSQTALQVLPQAVAGGVFSTPAYFNNTVYYAAINDYMKAFSIGNGQLIPVPIGHTPTGFVYPGATPSISANGTKDAILWAVENGHSAKLHAYDANDLSHELYNSDQAPLLRDQLGPGNKFIVPTVVGGKVYVGTTYGVTVYGL